MQAIVFTVCSAALVTSSALADTIEISGDLRVRAEQKTAELTTGSTTVEDDYLRSRIRARLKMATQINDQLRVTLQLATGDRGITSTNQTLGEGFTNKAFDLDMAYFEYQPIEGLALGGGKVKNPVHRPGGSQMVWDSDVTPEGFYANYQLQFEKLKIKPLLGSFTILENGSNSDLELGVVQLQVGYQFAENFAVNVGGGQYLFSGIEGSAVGRAGGNTVEVVSTDESVYGEDYTVTEIFVEGILQLAEEPLTIYYHAIENSEASENNTGTTFGVHYGKAKAVGSWFAGLYFRETAADATYSLFDDGDFNSGSLDTKGFALTGAYAVADNVTVNFTHYNYESPLDPPAGASEAAGTTSQLDLIMKF